MLAFLVRLNSLKVQDRLIRLEERLRYQQLLSPALCQQAKALTEGQMVALRFAGDDELEELVSAVLAGKFGKNLRDQNGLSEVGAPIRFEFEAEN